MIERLIEALEIRMKQFNAEFEGKPLKYKLHDGHHKRDIVTILAVLKNTHNAESLLANMPTEKDLP